MFPQMGMGTPQRACEPDNQVYLTDEQGVLLTDPDGNLIVEG